MKQKLTFVLSLVAMALSSAVYAAERVAPTLPESLTPEDGKSYWIYNVGTGKFLANSTNGGYAGVSIDGYVLSLTATDGGFTIRRDTEGSYYLYCSSISQGTISYYNGTPSSNNYKWRIASTTGGYTIQNYNTTEKYVGYTENGYDYIYSNMVEGDIVWKFLDPTQAAHYAAEVKLYEALENTNGTTLEGLDWFMGQYETLYANRASATVEQLTQSAAIINNGRSIYNGYVFPSWNEYPIIFTASEGNYGQDGSHTWALPDNSYTAGSNFYRSIYLHSGEDFTSRLTATVAVDQFSYFVYELGYISSNCTMKVFVDGEEVRSFTDIQLGHNFGSAGSNDRFSEALEAGTHTITWEFHAINIQSWNNSYSARISNIGCLSAPQISVSLLEPGSLGTEVLYNTDHIKNVKRLKVTGKMNNEDWDKIKMMTNLFDLDLSEAETTDVPNEQFQEKAFLHKVILPEGLTTIGRYAFNCSYIEEVVFPSTLKCIGENAFYLTHLKEAILPDGFTELGYNAFRSNDQLTKVDLGKNLTEIPTYCFYSSKLLKDVTIPNTVVKIGDAAFCDCYNLTLSSLPSELTTIGNSAFSYCHGIKSLIIPDKVTSIDFYAFQNCYGLESVEVPIAIYSLAYRVFAECSSLKTLKLNSATVVGFRSDSSPLSSLANVTLQVPSFLVNAYKLDSYWYNAKSIEGFDPSSIDYYEIHKNLTMNGRERFGTNPSVKIYENVYLKMNGSEPQNFKDFAISYNSQMWCTGDNIKATGDLSVCYWTSGKQWYFISLPFDMKVSDIDAGDAQYAIRYYDGANRAIIGASGSWKNYEADDVIPAGTGFIYQTSKDAWTNFHADSEGENKQQIFSTSEFSKPLELNTSVNTANRGWNLVGNPYQCYYNNHMLNFTAPITVWNVNNRTYTAYSLTDDDYAIRPNEAFFVQCPGEEMQTITFPTQGKQLTNVIESQNAAKQRGAQAAQKRQLIDLEVSNGDVTDKTRVVMNEEASLDYDMDCDASKFMSTESPQIYTIDEEGTAYAINERPAGEGEVQMGFYAPKSGAFTLSMPRCDAKKVLLVDEFENLTVDLTAQDYGFTASEGKQEARFRLILEDGEATGIKTVDSSDQTADGVKSAVYNLNGQRVGNDYKGIVIRNGKKYLSK